MTQVSRRCLRGGAMSPSCAPPMDLGARELDSTGARPPRRKRPRECVDDPIQASALRDVLIAKLGRGAGDRGVDRGGGRQRGNIAAGIRGLATTGSGSSAPRLPGQRVACSVNERCCGGVCSSGTCQSPGCLPKSSACSSASQCCDGKCSGGVCGGCLPIGTSCSNSAQCCNNNCIGGVCTASCTPQCNISADCQNTCPKPPRGATAATRRRACVT